METSVHRDRRRRRDDGLFFPITPRVIGVDPVSRPIASRVSRLYGKTVTFETVRNARAIDPRVSTRVRARPRVPSPARIDRAYFSSRVPRVAP